jgi:hypothetical protein
MALKQTQSTVNSLAFLQRITLARELTLSLEVLVSEGQVMLH